MKKLLMLIILFAMMPVAAAWAQFSDLMQFAQAQQSLSLFSYNGYVDVGYSAGVGYYKANKFEATTSHGVSNGRIFAGLGAGVDVLKTKTVEHPMRWDAGPQCRVFFLRLQDGSGFPGGRRLYYYR